MEESFNGWAVLELMGHRRLTGLVREVTLAGAGFLRIDVYEGPATVAKATQYYPPSSVYCLTPTSEEAARAAAMPWAPPALSGPRKGDAVCSNCGADYPQGPGLCLCENDNCDLCGDCCEARGLAPFGE